MMELPLEVRAEMALKAAVEQAIKEHAREGRPIYVGENDEVVEITAAELRNLYPNYPRDC
jgi:hypothetical protein